MIIASVTATGVNGRSGAISIAALIGPRAPWNSDKCRRFSWNSPAGDQESFAGFVLKAHSVTAVNAAAAGRPIVGLPRGNVGNGCCCTGEIVPKTFRLRDDPRVGSAEVNSRPSSSAGTGDCGLPSSAMDSADSLNSAIARHTSCEHRDARFPAAVQVSSAAAADTDFDGTGRNAEPVDDGFGFRKGSLGLQLVAVLQCLDSSAGVSEIKGAENQRKYVILLSAVFLLYYIHNMNIRYTLHTLTHTYLYKALPIFFFFLPNIKRERENYKYSYTAYIILRHQYELNSDTTSRIKYIF